MVSWLTRLCRIWVGGWLYNVPQIKTSHEFGGLLLYGRLFTSMHDVSLFPPISIVYIWSTHHAFISSCILRGLWLLMCFRICRVVGLIW